MNIHTLDVVFEAWLILSSPILGVPALCGVSVSRMGSFTKLKSKGFPVRVYTYEFF